MSNHSILPYDLVGCSFEGYHLEVLIEHNDVTGIFVCHSKNQYYIMKVALTKAAVSLVEHEQKMIEDVCYSGIVSFVTRIDIRGFPALILHRYIRGALTRYIGVFSVQDISKVFFRLCEICQYLYEKGIYHRDIKPENIVLDDSEMPVLIDFGMACRIGNQEDYFTGTFDYAAPEVVKEHRVTYESELYSIACVVYTLCHGRPPSKDSAVKKEHGLGSKEDAMLNRMLNPDPRKRRAKKIEEESHDRGPKPRSKGYRGLFIILVFILALSYFVIFLR